MKGPLGDVVKDVIKDLNKKGRLTEEEIVGFWVGATDKKTALHSRPVSLRKSILVVNVDGSSWLYELTLKKKEILKKLERAGRIRDIRFRIGEVGRRDKSGDGEK